MRNERKASIIVISPSSFPGTAGDSANYLELVNGFNREGLRVTLVCPEAVGGKQFDRDLRETGIRVVRIPFSPPRISDLVGKGLRLSMAIRLLVFYFLEVIVVSYEIMRGRPKACMVRHAMATIPLAPLLKTLRVRSVADGEILSSSREWGRFFSPWVRRLLQALEKWRLYDFFKVTGSSQLEALTKLGFSRSRIITTRIAIDVSSVPSFDIGNIPPATFGFFGALAEWQQVDFILRSFAKTAQRNELVKLYIIGDGPCKGELENLSKSLGLEKKVGFCGAVPRKTLWQKYFRKFRVAIMVQSEWMKHQPIKLAEALAAGKPIIVTGVRKLKHLKGKGLLLVRPGDEEDMARAIGLLAEDERLVRELSLRARAVAPRFDIKPQIRKILKAVG